MECNRCGEKQSQETFEDALVEGTANELFVCLKCHDEMNDPTCPNGKPWCGSDSDRLCGECAADRADYAYDEFRDEV